MGEGRARTLGVTVALCCHNSASLLPETLRHLAIQDVPDEVPWEVVVVDNASTDATDRIAEEEWSKSGSHVPLRVVEEPKPGIVAARNRAFEVAQYEFVLFCDDDNWLQQDYVRTVYDVMSGNQRIGALGGVGEPVFGTSEPSWFWNNRQYYAVGRQSEQSGDVTDRKGYVYGAGFVIRNVAWQEVKAAGFTGLLHDLRRGSNDIELCSLARIAGYRVWYEDSLRFRHYLTPERLTWSYFLRLTEVAHKTGVYVAPYRYVLANSGSYARPGRLHWLVRSASLLWRLTRRGVIGLRYLGQEGHPIHSRNRRLKGELRGWLAVRGRYPELCDRVHRLQGRLDSRPRVYEE